MAALYKYVLGFHRWRLPYGVEGLFVLDHHVYKGYEGIIEQLALQFEKPEKIWHKENLSL
jgi:hypothetical protein